MRTNWMRLGRGALHVGLVFLLGGVLIRADLSRAVGLLGEAPGVALAAVPGALAVVCDALGWRRLLPARPSPSIRSLVAARLAAQAVDATVPGGAVAGDVAAASFVLGSPGLSGSAVAASLASRRLFLVFAHGLTLLLAGGLGWGFLRGLRGGDTRVLLQAAPMAGAVLILLAVAAPRVLRLERWGAPATPATRPVSLPTAAFVSMWILESVETGVILHALRSGLGSLQVFVLDQLLTLVRGLAFFAPGGLGVVDITSMTLLERLVPGSPALGAAFVLAKRAREAAFAAGGYALLALRAAVPAAARRAWSPS